MDKIIYNEFGIRSEITKYTAIGPKLKGMKDGKPFVHENEIRINTNNKLHIVNGIHFFDKDNKEISRKDVRLDTEHRIAGIVVNLKNNTLLLNVIRSTNYYCFPGRHRREKGNISECLRREMVEETSIDISDYKIKHLINIKKEGLGHESFYVINLGNKEIVYKDENPEDKTTKLEVHKIGDIFKYTNVLPYEVVQKLKEVYK